MLAAGRLRHHLRGVFVFFSNRLGCAGSLLVSAVRTVVIIFALRACNA